MTRCAIYNQKLATSLIERHGVHPGKSKRDDPFPDVPEEYFCHFTRGYLDGDGSVGIYDYEYQQRKRVASFLGTKQFTQTLHDLLRQRVGLSAGNGPCQNNSTGKAWKIQWQGKEDLIRLRDYLYPPGDYPYLVRKRDKFTEATA